MSDVLIELRCTWPGTTIDGEPGIVDGFLEVSADPDGSATLNISVGNAGAPAEDCHYVEFVLPPAEADALARALTTRRTS